MRVTVPAKPLATQTAPSPNAMPVGGAPTPIVASTFRVVGSMRVTVLLSTFATQTLPSP